MIWICALIRPGSRVRPPRSIVRASLSGSGAPGPSTAAIRLPSISTVTPSRGSAPVPSIKRAFVSFNISILSRGYRVQGLGFRVWSLEFANSFVIPEPHTLNPKPCTLYPASMAAHFGRRHADRRRVPGGEVGRGDEAAGDKRLVLLDKG